MAKISKKPSPLKAFEINSLTELLSGGLSDAYGAIKPESVVHAPNTDVYSTASDLVLEVEIPGARREDIEVYIHKNVLTVKALKYECFDEEKINYVCMERVFGRILRCIELPFPVDTSHIKASYKNGLLTITVPRIDDKRAGAKKIPVSTE